jgi:hypothetical protein
MHAALRVGVGILAALQLVVGCWALFFPRNFFALPVVGMGMAYNQHLMADYGAMTLASAVVLTVAAINRRPLVVRTSLAMYLVWAVPHFVIHLQMVDRLSPATGTVLLILLGAAVLLPLTLLALSIVAERPRRDVGSVR